MMKRNHALRAVFILVIVLLLALPAAFAEEPSLELTEGVTWELTYEELLELEGVTDEEELDVYSDGDFTQYSFMRDTAADEPAMYDYYIYRDEQLVMYGTGMISGGDDLTALFDAQYELLFERYGEATDQDKAWFISMFDILEEGTISEELLVAYEAWDLGGDTKLCLTNADNQSVVRVYINAAAMTGETE